LQELDRDLLDEPIVTGQAEQVIDFVVLARRLRAAQNRRRDFASEFRRKELQISLIGSFALARKPPTYSDLINADKSQTRAPLHASVAKTLIAINKTANHRNRALTGGVSATIFPLWGGGTSVATDIEPRLALTLIKCWAIL
jgi:hypothetical protein